MRELQIKFVSNPVTVRWLRILNFIEREESFTIVKLSEILKVSQRTLITDIGFLKKHFARSANFSFNSNRYKFIEKERMLYQEQKQQLLKNEILFDIMGNIFYGELETVAELADYFNYSESTLRRFLSIAQKAIEEYDLKLKYNPVTILGKEQNIRRFFFDFYYEGEETSHTLHPPADLYTVMSKKISENIDDHELGTGCTISAFYYILYITMERSRQGYNVSLPEELKEVAYREKDFKELFSFQSLIESKYGVFLSKEEFSWIHYQLLTRRTLDKNEMEDLFYERFNLWPELDVIAMDFFTQNQVDKKREAILSPFIKSFFLSRKLNDSISPVLNKLMDEEKSSVISKNLDELRKNIQFLNKHQAILQLSDKYFDDVAISLTLYSRILLRYYAPARNILFLIEGDYYIVQYIRTQAQQLLGNWHNIQFVKISNLTESYLKNTHVDLLVTNYSVYVSDFNLTKDYILLKQVPDSKDWRRVIDKLNYLAENPY